MAKVFDHCKFVTIDSIIVSYMIHILYNVLNEHTGGLAHIVADENNLDDESLRLIIEECNKEENKDRDDVHVCKILCESLLRLTLNQRYFVFAFIENGNDTDILAQMATDNCWMINQPGLCHGGCNFKWNFNKFYAEKKCIEETGSNEKFIDGKWPIQDIMEV